MQKTLLVIIAFAALLSFSIAFAIDDPHGSASSINCDQCHINHGSMGNILINATDSLVSTLCLSCHTPGGWSGMSKTMSTADKAEPGTSGISHAWDVPSANADRGASLPTSQPLLDHLSADNRITCATCHDPHNNTNSPFLRLDNSANALCLDCHADRDNSNVRTFTGSELSHPIGNALPATTEYHNPPLDTDGNPQPSDGNTTNDFALLSGSVVSCTTCHGVHYTDSNSGTTDGP
jgi:predicted CXXCH cytochrome family protein